MRVVPETPGARQLQILLDGQDVTSRCVEADDEAGYVVCIDPFAIDFSNFKSCGKVEIGSWCEHDRRFKGQLSTSALVPFCFKCNAWLTWDDPPKFSALPMTKLREERVADIGNAATQQPEGDYYFAIERKEPVVPVAGPTLSIPCEALGLEPPKDVGATYRIRGRRERHLPDVIPLGTNWKPFVDDTPAEAFAKVLHEALPNLGLGWEHTKVECKDLPDERCVEWFLSTDIACTGIVSTGRIKELEDMPTAAAAAVARFKQHLVYHVQQSFEAQLKPILQRFNEQLPPDRGLCGQCGLTVYHHYPWWTNNPDHPDAKPLHDGNCSSLWASENQTVATKPLTLPRLTEEEREEIRHQFEQAAKVPRGVLPLLVHTALTDEELAKKLESAPNFAPGSVVWVSADGIRTPANLFEIGERLRAVGEHAGVKFVVSDSRMTLQDVTGQLGGSVDDAELFTALKEATKKSSLQDGMALLRDRFLILKR